MTSLRIIRSNSYDFLEEINQNYQDSWDLKKRILRTSQFCGFLHKVGIANLMVDANHYSFFLQLLRAGLNWKELLAYAKEKGEEIPASKMMPLIGTLAAGNFELALEIAELSATKMISPEYEDEFYFPYFIQQYLITDFGKDDPNDTLEEMLDPIEDAFEDISDSKIEICKALFEKDTDQFHDAFLELHSEYDLAMDEKLESNAFAREDTLPQKSLWLEGLALLQLAKQAGFHKKENYPFFPPKTTKIIQVPRYDDFLLEKKGPLPKR